MREYLKSKYDKVIATNEYIVAEGAIPAALVAHLDTVGPVPPQDIFYDNKKNVMWSPQLLGADDRAGIYAAIEIIERGYRPHIIFTTDEEIGCVGAFTLVQNHPNLPFEECKVLIQLDRQGKSDCVFYDCNNKEFKRFVKYYGFKEQSGSFSDISILAPNWGVAAVNLSVGYYLEHTNAEYLRCNELEKTIEKVTMMLEDIEFDIIPFYCYINLLIL